MKFSKLFLMAAVCCGLMVSSVVAQEKKSDDEKKKKEIAAVTKMMMGKWEIDKEKSLAAAKKAEADENQIQQIEEMADNSMVVEFGKDGEMGVDMGQFQMDGDWEVSEVKTKDKKKHIVLTTEMTGPDGSSQEMTLNAIVLEKGVVKMWPDNQEESAAVVFKRVKEKKKDKKEKKDKKDK